MSKYTDSVERGLEGLSAVSTGTCPGCETCRESFGDYKVEFDWDDAGRERYRVPAYEEFGGKKIWMRNEETAEFFARRLFAEAWSNGDVWNEPSFSHSGCDICGSEVGGDNEVWHAVGEDGEILHFTDACCDCVMYLANGDEPGEW
jgi:hypothetical protein